MRKENGKIKFNMWQKKCPWHWESNVNEHECLPIFQAQGHHNWCEECACPIWRLNKMLKE